MSLLLITGGAGFVLCHLARLFVTLGPDNRVIVLDSGPFDAETREFLHHPRIRSVAGSVTDAACLAALPDRDRIRYVVHGAAITSIRARIAADGLAGALEPLQVNVMGTAQVLAFAQRLPDLYRFINLSSGAVYARAARNPDGPLPETGAVSPEGIYAISKLTAEALVTEAALLGMPAHSVRLAGVFGPMDRARPSRSVDGVVKRLVQAARDGRALGLGGLAGGGDFLSAQDVALALCGLLQSPHLHHSLYNIARGQFTTLAELAGAIPGLVWHDAAFGADVSCDPGDIGGRNGPYAINRITADTDWRPAPLAQGLTDYLRWLADHPA